MGEIKLFRCLRNGIKADESPWCNRHNCKYPAQRGLTFSIEREGRIKICSREIWTEKCGDRQKKHTGDKRKRQNSLKLSSNTDAADTENGKDHQCKNCKQNFSGINAVPFYRIEIAPLGKIWKQITTNKSQSGGVQWNDSKVRKTEKPCA